MKVLTTEAWLEKALRVRGQEFDYSRVVYVKSQEKIEIGCRVCGSWFWQRPVLHLHATQKQGCPNCKRNKLRCLKAWTLQKALSVAVEKHKDSFDYSKVDEYKNQHSKWTIICRACDHEFKSTVSNHVSAGKGCPKCANNIPIGLEEAIRRAHTVHGYTYDYSLATYKNSHTQILIKHLTCGREFKQSFHSHTYEMSGCPYCVHTCSFKETAWLTSINIPDDSLHRQVVIPGTNYRVDALVDHVVYEFNGTYWHGDPRRYPDRSFVNAKNKISMGDLYDRTLDKQNKLEKLGYQVKFVWELDYDAGLLFSEEHPAYTQTF